MFGGRKGGSTTSSVTIPKWLEDAAKTNIGRADVLSTIGYTPYYGPDVAALTPQQVAAMQGTGQAASAFGLPGSDPMAGMPQSSSYGGVPAYSSSGIYEGALAELAASRPGQYAALMAPFIDPVTGAAPASPFGPLVPGASPVVPRSPVGSGQNGDRGSSGDGRAGSYGSGSGGYSGLRDTVDGGGPGASGGAFEGGALSGALNSVGVRPAGSGRSSGMGGRK